MANPKPLQDRQQSPAFPYRGYDTSLDRRYDAYINKVVPRHVASLHESLEITFNQIPFAFVLKNDGDIRAEHLVVELRSIGGTMHDKFALKAVFGPSAPTIRQRDLFPQVIQSDQLGGPIPVARHEMEFVVGPNGGNAIEVHCSDFRHGRSWEFEGIATIDPCARSPFKILVRCTAANMHGAKTAPFEFPFRVATAKATELIDFEKQEWLIDFPMRERLAKELDAKNYDWFVGDEDDGGGDDDDD